MSETSNVISGRFRDCAILSHVDHWKAFSFDKQTGECKGFIEDVSAVTRCPSPGGARLYKRQNALPVTVEDEEEEGVTVIGTEQSSDGTSSTALPITVEDEVVDEEEEGVTVSGTEQSSDGTTSTDCPLPPVPPGYSIEHPYNGNTDLARYRCQALTDQPPVDHCPLVKCGSTPDTTTQPASCSVKDWFNITSEQYEGGVTCTIGGVTCQRWDTDDPHSISYYEGRSDLGNRCQLDSEDRPWCHTIDPDIRFDFCPFANLNCGHPLTVPLPPTMIGARIEVEWPYKQYYEELAWYRCASFVTTDPVPSCPLTHCDGDLTWSNVNVSCSVKDCYDATNLTYSGRVSCTENGITCQRWDTDEPHSHQDLSGRSDLENWCQIFGEEKPWCYTTNPHFRWEYCPVEECP
ncbi:plasminogen-like [Mizuhopecten yessoensis]|nr:plasminogen-like [Mizuhopecten yessoensis]